MRFSVILPFAFIASVFAAPTHYTRTQGELPLIKEVDGVLDNLGLTLDNTISELATSLGLHQVDEDLNSVLVQIIDCIVDPLVNNVDDVVDGLLQDLGLGSVVTLDRTFRITFPSPRRVDDMIS
jgi:hypothetical protein